ncbi:hypothetical protein ACQ4M3_06115 [Leptolyngbya sp. AN03gr2]|uniref:hypothetical protein n=1 Tax=unclassified Leptolyngbya TaxID=2650499 RepID=UPI003D310AFA
MNRNNWIKLISIGILSTGATVLPMSLLASAQVAQPGVGLEREGIYDNDNDAWGLWGLVGLVGLFGLVGRGKNRDANRNDATAYRDPSRY